MSTTLLFRPTGPEARGSRFDTGHLNGTANPGRLSLPISILGTPVQDVIAAQAHGPSSVHAGDIDGDGIDDVIHSASVGNLPPPMGYISWWKHSEGEWTENPVTTTFIGPFDVFSADIGGESSLWPQRALDIDTPGLDPFAFTADVTGNGLTEILGSAGTYAPNQLFFWNVTAYLPSGQLTSSILDGGPVSIGKRSTGMLCCGNPPVL